MQGKRYTAILFDLDGTLLDTLDDLADSMNSVLAELGLPTHPVDDYRCFIGNGLAKTVERTLPPSRISPERMQNVMAMFRAEYAKRWRVKTRLYDGVAEMLDRLVARALKLAVFSNKPHDFTRMCVAEFLPQWPFAAVLGQREGIAIKPDPAGALEAARFLDERPADFLYLGDTGVDMQAATAAGMFPVGALWGFRTEEELRENGAQALLKRPSEILRLIEA